MNIELWKPLNVIKCNYPNPEVNDTDGDRYKINPFYFNEFWECYSWKDSNNRWWNESCNMKPIVFDKNDKNYFYLIQYYDQEIKKNRIDLSKIFLMDKNDFKSFINFENEVNDINNQLITNEIQLNIMDNIKKRIMTIPPEFALIEIKKDKKLNSCVSETLYWSEKLFLDFINLIKSGESIYSEQMDDKTYSLLPSLIARKNSKSTWERMQFANGMDFCVKFLEKFYPKDVNLFLEKQNVTKEWINKNIKGYNLDKIYNANKIKEKNEIER